MPFRDSRGADERRSGIYVGSRSDVQHLRPSRASRMLGRSPPRAESSHRRVIRHEGTLLLVSDDALMAYPFDTDQLRIDGEPVPIADGVGAVDNGPVSISLVSASSTGALAYRPLGPPPRQASMTLVDRRGVETPLPWDTPAEPPGHVRASPEGRRVAAIFNDDLWVLSSKGRSTNPLDGFRELFDFPSGHRTASRRCSSRRARRRHPAKSACRPAGSTPTGVADGSFLAFGWGRDGRVVATHVIRPSDTNIVRFRPDASAAIDLLADSPAVEGDGGAAVSLTGDGWPIRRT